MDSDSGAPDVWAFEIDWGQRRASWTRAFGGPSNWARVGRDESVSAPDGSFDVYVDINSSEPPIIVKVVAMLDDAGELASPHPDLKQSVIDSVTTFINPSNPDVRSHDHWISWPTGALFHSVPRPWSVVHERAPRISVTRGDITELAVDAVVNSANARMRGGGGVSGAIHAAGGPAVLADCIERYPNGLHTGEAGWTTAGNMPAQWVIHTVGPNYSAGQTDPALLASSYRRSLAVADELGAQSVAFPLLSAGIFGWPKEDAIAVAVDTLTTTPTKVQSIQLVAYDQATFEQINYGLAIWTPRRILEGVRVLHERGFQRVRILPGMAPSGMYWRVAVTTAANVTDEDGYPGLRDWDTALTYSTGAAVEFAGGAVTPTTSPEEVADMILRALPSVRQEADQRYADWYAGLLGMIEERREPMSALPIAYAEYFSDREGWELGWGSGIRYPRPPA